jgi:hypothetical protein
MSPGKTSAIFELDEHEAFRAMSLFLNQFAHLG